MTVKDNLQSVLEVESILNEDEEFEYSAKIDTEPILTESDNGTTIYLNKNTKNLVENYILAESIAKRINLMYDTSNNDKDGFIIYLEDYKINKSFRDKIRQF